MGQKYGRNCSAAGISLAEIVLSRATVFCPAASIVDRDAVYDLAIVPHHRAPPTAGVNAEKRCYLAMKRRDLDGFLYVHAGTAWWMGRSGPGPGGERGQERAGVSRKRRERCHVLDT